MHSWLSCRNWPTCRHQLLRGSWRSSTGPTRRRTATFVACFASARASARPNSTLLLEQPAMQSYRETKDGSKKKDTAKTPGALPRQLGALLRSRRAPPPPADQLGSLCPVCISG